VKEIPIQVFVILIPLLSGAIEPLNGASVQRQIARRHQFEVSMG
jgi:hypothetical protein